MPPETLTEPETRLQNVTQNASTVSPTSQRTTLSSEQVASAKLLTLGTEPTSQPSDSCKAIDEGSVQEKHGENVYVQKRRIDSDLEAQYGSDSIHSWGSAESSSNSLDDSSKDLPQPSRDLKIKYIGGHFGEVVPQWEEARAFPNNDTEDRFMKDKTERARATTRAADRFESHLLPDAEPELSIHREQIVGSWVKRRTTSTLRRWPISKNNDTTTAGNTTLKRSHSC